MKLKIKLPKDAHITLHTLVSVLKLTVSDTLKNMNLESGFCLARPPSSHKLENCISSKESSWINQRPGCGQLWPLLQLALPTSLPLSSGLPPPLSLSPASHS